MTHCSLIVLSQGLLLPCCFQLPLAFGAVHRPQPSACLAPQDTTIHEDLHTLGITRAEMRTSVLTTAY